MRGRRRGWRRAGGKKTFKDIHRVLFAELWNQQNSETVYGLRPSKPIVGSP